MLKDSRMAGTTRSARGATVHAPIIKTKQGLHKDVPLNGPNINKPLTSLRLRSWKCQHDEIYHLQSVSLSVSFSLVLA